MKKINVSKLSFFLVLIIVFTFMSNGFTSKAIYDYTEIAPDWYRYDYGNSRYYYYYRGNAEDVTIPSEIPSLFDINYGDMYDKIKVIRVPASMKEVGFFAFSEMDNLRYVVFEGKDITFADENQKFGNVTNFVGKKGSTVEKYAPYFGVEFTTDEVTKLNKKKISLLVGDTYNNVLLSNRSDIISVTSNKPSVVKVLNSEGQIKAKKEGKARITVSTADGNKYSYTVKVLRTTVDNRVAQIKQTKISKKMSKLDRAREAHDWLIENVEYDHDNYVKKTIPDSSYTVSGALLKKVCVCQGYALAYKKLMDAYGVPCVYVTGTSRSVRHGWNMVQIGNKWYHVDVTFDDSSTDDLVRYTYFLKSTDYMKYGHHFDESNYPKCKSKKYDNIRVKFF